jgi:hypothetical protein
MDDIRIEVGGPEARTSSAPAPIRNPFGDQEFVVQNPEPEPAQNPEPEIVASEIEPQAE